MTHIDENELIKFIQDNTNINYYTIKIVLDYEMMFLAMKGLIKEGECI